MLPVLWDVTQKYITVCVIQMDANVRGKRTNRGLGGAGSAIQVTI